MAQFDPLIIFPLLYSTVIILNMYYYIFIKINIPMYFEIKKFKKKTLDLAPFYLFLKHNNKLLNFKMSYKQTILFLF
jgi:hypothetical protein